jgi:Cu(I)/Ag(I) efflux system protein CusF
MRILLTSILAALTVSAPVHGQDKGVDPAPHHPAAAGDLVDGEIRKVDAEAAKITIRHGEIKSLDMPAMTMAFTVKDKTMVEKVKVGDKVKFKAVSEGGQYVVTELQLAQ